MALAAQPLAQSEQPSLPAAQPLAAPASIASAALGFGLTLSLFATLSGRLSLWLPDGPELAPSMTRTLLIGTLIAALAAGQLARTRFASFQTQNLIEGCAATLIVVFISDWLTRSYSLLPGPSIRGEILLGAALGYFVLRRFGAAVFSIGSALFALAALFYSFASTVQHRLILGDDHSVFLHRLSLLKQNFPHIPVYDTSWNGGLDSLHLFATGVLNVFFIHLPLVWFFPVEDIYSSIVGLTLFGLVPLCSYAAARQLRLAPAVAALSATLSTTQGLFFYRWGLVYGTMGFITSCALLPFVFALLCRAFEAPLRFSPRQGLLLFFSCALLLCWPLAGVPLAVLGACLIARLRVSIRSKPLVLSCLAVFLVTLPWVYILWSGWNVKSFISAKKPATHATAETTEKHKGHVFRVSKREVGLPDALRILRNEASPTNPLLLLLAAPGIFLLSGTFARVYLGTGLFLFAVALIGGPLKPQLELERMLLMLSCLLVIPSAAALYQLLRSRHRLLAALGAGFLFAGIVGTAGVLSNRRIEQFHLARTSFYELAQLIETHAGSGRALFSGFVLHELNQGHLAPLSHFTSVPMLASSHVHNVWQYRDIIPDDFKERGIEGILSYLDLWNASLVLAHDPVWQAFFSRYPEHFRLVGSAGRFMAFQRERFPDSFFLRGEGKIVEQTTAGIKLFVSSGDAVLRFRYNRFLKVAGCAHLEPYEDTEEGGLRFISLSGCKADTPIRISSKLFFERKFDGVEQVIGALQ